ncbi:MAG TPA: hypothetical protein VNJ08_17490 [Bacteriovoracaceae bacterium]|nr:hypothetical protein [Bacteriovoracaceae bacterium]
MKSKTPFDRFVEESENIRKTPLSKHQIQRINEIAKEVAVEEEQNTGSSTIKNGK